jgi:ABC-2 type transport system ATP-binding protein
MKDIIKFENVMKSYGKIQALKGISFSVSAGRIFGIFGPNGAGKTTTIKIILGILKHDAGQVEVGTDNFSYLPEELSLDQSEKVKTMINYISKLKGIKGKRRDKEVDRWEEILEIKEFYNRKIFELSKGQKKRVMFLLSLLGNPDVMALDEPFTGLDAEAAESLKKLVTELKSEGKTIIFSTHILEIAENICEDVLILKDGEIRAFGEIEALKEKHLRRGWILKLKEVETEMCAKYEKTIIKEKNIIEVLEDISLDKILKSVNESNVVEIKRKYPDFKELYFKSVGEK